MAVLVYLFAVGVLTHIPVTVTAICSEVIYVVPTVDAISSSRIIAHGFFGGYATSTFRVSALGCHPKISCLLLM